ncbi:eukaryotic peptide chain release factor subunit 1-1-like [Durio zibethinus]|uniref:Eukaryotic peptide chain release factor subunit 1-1-like n=1 Tax=Durio zibethinus TaxID=66656 RepID=A0A6P6BJ44_DURZI|nr:eukaryotic peptide chain release factor subunit 1-1-like [Durio zibethinus]
MYLADFWFAFDIDSALMECLKMLPDRRTLLKIFASRIFKKVLKECSIVYGGRYFLDEALNQSVDILGNVVVVIQKRMLKEYLELVANKDARCVVHIESIMKLLELNVLGVVFLWNEVDLVAFELQDITTGARKMEYKKQGEELDIRGNFVIISKELVLERVLQLCRTRDIQLVLAAKEHQEGSMFYRSQGGIGAILKAKEEICKLLEEERMRKVPDYYGRFCRSWLLILLLGFVLFDV